MKALKRPLITNHAINYLFIFIVEGKAEAKGGEICYAVGIPARVTTEELAALTDQQDRGGEL